MYSKGQDNNNSYRGLVYLSRISSLCLALCRSQSTFGLAKARPLQKSSCGWRFIKVSIVFMATKGSPQCGIQTTWNRFCNVGKLFLFAQRRRGAKFCIFLGIHGGLPSSPPPFSHSHLKAIAALIEDYETMNEG